MVIIIIVMTTRTLKPILLAKSGPELSALRDLIVVEVVEKEFASEAVNLVNPYYYIFVHLF